MQKFLLVWINVRDRNAVTIKKMRSFRSKSASPPFHLPCGHNHNASPPSGYKYKRRWKIKSCHDTNFKTMIFFSCKYFRSRDIYDLLIWCYYAIFSASRHLASPRRKSVSVGMTILKCPIVRDSKSD
jgi:hypothetical protein